MNKEYILVVFSENEIGVLNRITAHYLRRKINIESLKVSESSIKGISMFVISAYTIEEQMVKITEQIKKIVEVLDVNYYLSDELITQEIALFKVSTDVLDGTGRIDSMLKFWGAQIIEVTSKYIVIEKSGNREDIEALKTELDKFNILIDSTRSGSVVLHRESLELKLNELIANK